MNGVAGHGRTIQLFLVHGQPAGLRKATIHGWTGMLFISGDAAFGALTARDEVKRTGVYILVGPDEDGFRTRAYIGSGNSVAERVQGSAKNRGFWETVVTVTTSDDDLSKGHAEYLEARLIELAASARRVVLDNSTQPDSSRRRLPEADVANMEQFLENLQVILPVVGLDLLKPQPPAVRTGLAPLDPPGGFDSTPRFIIRHKSGVEATATEEDGEFVVLAGSEALLNTSYASAGPAKLRAQLIADGVLIPAENGMLRFARAYAFNSPSAASGVILNRSSNGRVEWRVEGKTSESYSDLKTSSG